MLLKKSRLYDNDHDLCMNNLVRFSSKSLFYLNQRETIYKFRISDLLKLINTNLLYTHVYNGGDDLFHEPQFTKNPYNNIKLKLHDYYNIYFAAKKSDYTMPPLFHLWFLDNFNIKSFAINNHVTIRDEYIKQMYSCNNRNLESEIRKMLIKVKSIVKFVIDKEFPKDILIKAFSHIYKDYLYYRYSLNDTLIHSSCVSLKLKLSEFFNHSPLFDVKNMCGILYSMKEEYECVFETCYPKIRNRKTSPREQ